MQERDARREEVSSQQRRNQLPPLAPRSSLASSSSQDRPATSGSGRPPRLSHRSRAGCWTCRGRKVKCDEIHPRCGPCTRLNRECDWDHRWHFSDATPSTQGKYTNVTTTGNAVWDPSARSSPSPSPSRQFDDLPSFASLTNDEERERKAETQLPGTFGVVVTPDSFSKLPEYAAAASPETGRRMSIQSSRRGSLALESPLISQKRTTTRTDPNTVVLQRFEDASPALGQPVHESSPARRPSFAENMQHLSLSTSDHTTGTVVPGAAQIAQPRDADNHLVQHFRCYVVRRIVQPLMPDLPNDRTQRLCSRDMFEVIAAGFLPLHHAICAVSALNLSYSGHVPLEEAMQHYHQALSSSATPTTPDDLFSDGVFLRHVLLLIYDICVPITADEGGTNMWAEHFRNLRTIVVQRSERLEREPFAYIIWMLCELDVRACQLGHGSCEFLQTVLQRNMLPPLERQIPRAGPTDPGLLPHEVNVFPKVLSLNQGIVIHAGKLAQLAYTCRSEASSRGANSPDMYARWQARVSRLQNELMTFWAQNYPEYLVPESHQAAHNMPYRVRWIFENAFLMYQAAVIYSRTSMFPGQRMLPVPHQHDTHADTERRCFSILTLVAEHLEANMMERRRDIFPLFMAGFATTQPDVKIQAMNLAKAFEAQGGIGQNTYRTRQLLVAVCEEQRRMTIAGGRMEHVDWLTIARERGLGVVVCGL